MNTKSKTSRKNLIQFIFDFDSLYDSLDPSVVFRALDHAMEQCRPEWTPEFITWIKNLVQISFDLAVGEFNKGYFYKAKGELPTGGSISVEIGNIAVYFVLINALYD